MFEFFRKSKQFIVNGWILGFTTPASQNGMPEMKQIYLVNELITKELFKDLKNEGGKAKERMIHLKDDEHFYVIAIHLKIQDGWTGEFIKELKYCLKEFQEVAEPYLD